MLAIIDSDVLDRNRQELMGVLRAALFQAPEAIVAAHLPRELKSLCDDHCCRALDNEIK